MSAKRVQFIVVALGLLALSLSAGACKGEGRAELTAADYFAQVDQLDADLMQKLDELLPESEAAAASGDAEQAVLTLQKQAEAIRRFADGLAALNPPTDLAQTHQAAVEGASEIEQAFSNATDNAAAAQPPASSPDEMFEAAFQGVDLTTLFDQYNAACLDIEAAAANAGITIDLDCD